MNFNKSIYFIEPNDLNNGLAHVDASYEMS